MHQRQTVVAPVDLMEGLLDAMAALLESSEITQPNADYTRQLRQFLAHGRCLMEMPETVGRN